MGIDKKKITSLIEAALEVRQNAYAPYSKFLVGAALLTDDDEIFCGVNIENASYGATICAERVAFDNAVALGKHDFKAIAIVSGGEFAYPCGICRQVMAEFCDDKFLVVIAKNSIEYEMISLGQLLPKAFKLK